MTAERHRQHIVAFPVDHVIDHCVISRRNFYLGLWAGRELGLADEALQNYARSIVEADYRETGREDVIRKLLDDFSASGRILTRDQIERELHRAQTIAAWQLAMSD